LTPLSKNGGSIELERKTNIKHHSQADDLRDRFKVPKWGVFCHTARLRNRPPRLKLDLSDSTIVFKQTLFLHAP